MRPRLAASALVAVALVVAACGSDTSPTWTGVPSGQPSAGPTASAVPSGLPSPSAAPASPSSAPSPAPTPVAGGWSVVKTAPCPDESRFTCVTLAVPKDHFVAGGPTWDVTYAIHRAAGTPKGTFVTITGGPGTSGISVADSYSDAFPEGVEKQYDVVFLDQRGIGLSGPIQCAEATAAFYGSTARPQDPSQAAAAGAAAAAYVDACLAEAKVAAVDLPFYATRQAVEDLEAIREQLGVAEAPPLRRELRNPVRPDVRLGSPGPDRHALPRRAGGPDARRRELLRGGGAGVRRRADRDAQHVCHGRGLRHGPRRGDAARHLRRARRPPGGRAHRLRLPHARRDGPVADPSP